MGELKPNFKNKEGRSNKAVNRSQQLAVMCILLKRKPIEIKAKNNGVCLSEYLRNLALQGQAIIQLKALPKEVLPITATLNHIAAKSTRLQENAM